MKFIKQIILYIKDFLITKINYNKLKLLTTYKLIQAKKQQKKFKFNPFVPIKKTCPICFLN